MNSLLPPGSTPLERRLAQTCSGISDLQVPLRDLWNPATCPVSFLPYLAWAFSVDRWDEGWTESVKRQVVKDAFYIHQHKGTTSAVRRVVEPFGFLIHIIEWWQTGEAPGTFRLDIGVQDQGITEDTYLELERLISDAKPCSRHMIGMSINLQTSGPHWVGAASYLGEEITIYPYINETIISGGTAHEGGAVHVILKITHMAVGDGGGVLPTPDAKQTALVNEKRRAALNMLYIDPQNSSQIIAEQVIPENEGGWWIREVGLFDESGALIAVGNCPESYKPQLAEGSGRTQTVRMVLITSSTDNITLKIDPAVVLATRKYVDDKVLELKVYVDDLMAKHLAAPDPHSQYAQKESPTFTGTPKAPTPAAGNNTTQVATTAFVQAALTAIINGAPATLDTLKEIAVAINNDPKFSTTINNALALKAPLLSPALTGTPTAPTAAQSVNNTQIATTAFVKSAIAAMVGSAPAALDTLNELAAALGNDPNFATTMLNALAGKQPLDNTLTNLSGKDVAGLLAYLGLGEAAKRNVGTGDNQIPDMGAFASGSGWFRLPGGYIVQFGTFSGNTTRFISGHFPIPFPNQPMVSVSVMSDNVQSDPSIPAPQVLSVNFEHISNSAWRVATSDISQQYRFSYISIGR
ncbi:phage tail protein I [Salmonella enterica subsp. enterica serovar Typhi]|nr:phage tail protein I [Salmonella enterica subsp. enterica serovar Typhi]